MGGGGVPSVHDLCHHRLPKLLCTSAGISNCDALQVLVGIANDQAVFFYGEPWYSR